MRKADLVEVVTLTRGVFETRGVLATIFETFTNCANTNVS